MPRSISKKRYALLVGKLLEGSMHRYYFDWLMGDKDKCCCFKSDGKTAIPDMKQNTEMRFHAIEQLEYEQSQTQT